MLCYDRFSPILFSLFFSSLFFSFLFSLLSSPLLFRKLTLAHLNVNSLRNKVDQLEVFLESEEPNIMCFSEHHLKEQERGTIFFENYYEGSAYCRQQKTRGGTVIYVDKKNRSEELRVADLIEEGSIEMCAVKLIDVKITVACVYRPPSGSYKVFFRNFRKLADRLCKGDRTVFICGDFNIDLMASENRKDRIHKQKLIQTLNLYGLKACFDAPTRETESSKTLIDNVLNTLCSLTWSQSV